MKVCCWPSLAVDEWVRSWDFDASPLLDFLKEALKRHPPRYDCSLLGAVEQLEEKLTSGEDDRQEEQKRADDAELIEWFHSDGSNADFEALEVSLRSLLPDDTFSSLTSRPCAVTVTASGYPYLGWVEDDLAVAIGGNGLAAKSCDELGRLAASLFSPDGWVDSLDAEVFEPQLLT